MDIAGRPRPVLVVMSTLAAVDFILGGAALSEVVSYQIVGLAILISGAVKTGLQFYLQGQVTPNSAPETPGGVKLVPEDEV